MSEDCLYLNIVAPKAALVKGAKKLPVMVWIHGGALFVGSGNEDDIAPLVASSKDRIVGVTLNYRLGVLGFLGGSDLSARTRGEGSGNYGIQDQRSALSWVRAHIGAFGGDGEDITIFGQSAGGLSVINHLAQPASFPLYKKAIIESGTYFVGAKTMKEAEASYRMFLDATNCTSLECLVLGDAKSLVDVGNALVDSDGAFLFEGNTQPVVDNVRLTDTPAALIDAKLYNNKVPIIIGSNRDEEVRHMPRFPNLTEAEFDAMDEFSKMDNATFAELKRIYAPEVYPYPADLKGYSIWYWTPSLVWVLAPCVGWPGCSTSGDPLQSTPTCSP
jgi:para-nitrobenzyl esterase